MTSEAGPARHKVQQGSLVLLGALLLGPIVSWKLLLLLWPARWTLLATWVAAEACFYWCVRVWAGAATGWPGLPGSQGASTCCEQQNELRQQPRMQQRHRRTPSYSASPLNTNPTPLPPPPATPAPHTLSPGCDTPPHTHTLFVLVPYVLTHTHTQTGSTTSPPMRGTTASPLPAPPRASQTQRGGASGAASWP